MTDYPDIYADGFSLSIGDYGVTLTLQRSEPTSEPGQHENPNVIVARIRMTPNLLTAISESFGQLLAAQQTAGKGTQVSH